MKVALLAALETPGGRIDRIARQLLAWGRVIPSDEIVTKVDAVTVEEVRTAGQRLLPGAADTRGDRPDQGPAGGRGSGGEAAGVRKTAVIPGRAEGASPGPISAEAS